MRCRAICKSLLTALGLLLSRDVWASMLNMPVGVTPISRDTYHLHMAVLWICVGIGVVVFGVMFYILINHRKSKGCEPAKFHSNLGIEILWGVIPLVLLIIMAIPATTVLLRVNDTSDADINIKVTGYQWKWKYDYLDENISFFSNMSTTQDEIHNKAAKKAHYLLDVDNVVVIPIHKRVRFLITANDVIHSWYVPELGVKKDAVPGFIHESWAQVDTPGIYRGQCAELCGVNHAYMPIVVDARTEEDYAKWVAAQKNKGAQAAAAAEKTWTQAELMETGKAAYEKWCAVCHKPDGTGMPPAFPALKGSAVAKGPIKDHINIVLHGKAGTAMQAFASQLTDTDIAAIVTYERNAWGNNMNDLAQPGDVKKLR